MAEKKLGETDKKSIGFAVILAKPMLTITQKIPFRSIYLHGKGFLFIFLQGRAEGSLPPVYPAVRHRIFPHRSATQTVYRGVR